MEDHINLEVATSREYGLEYSIQVRIALQNVLFRQRATFGLHQPKANLLLPKLAILLETNLYPSAIMKQTTSKRLRTKSMSHLDSFENGEASWPANHGMTPEEPEYVAEEMLYIGEWSQFKRQRAWSLSDFDLFE